MDPIGTHIFLLGIVGNALIFVFRLTTNNENKSTYFYLTVKFRM